jgi:hypothetical protein
VKDGGVSGDFNSGVIGGVSRVVIDGVSGVATGKSNDCVRGGVSCGVCCGARARADVSGGVGDVYLFYIRDNQTRSIPLTLLVDTSSTPMLCKILTTEFRARCPFFLYDRFVPVDKWEWGVRYKLTVTNNNTQL